MHNIEIRVGMPIIHCNQPILYIWIVIYTASVDLQGKALTWCLFQYIHCLFKYWDSHDQDKMVSRPSYLYNGFPYTGKTSLYWISPLGAHAGQQYLLYHRPPHPPRSQRPCRQHSPNSEGHRVGSRHRHALVPRGTCLVLLSLRSAACKGHQLSVSTILSCILTWGWKTSLQCCHVSVMASEITGVSTVGSTGCWTKLRTKKTSMPCIIGP